MYLHLFITQLFYIFYNLALLNYFTRFFILKLNLFKCSKFTFILNKFYYSICYNLHLITLNIFIKLNNGLLKMEMIKRFH